jgi:endonuclease/exonuclease/phosphatase family metal-dependent hydrolase
MSSLFERFQDAIPDDLQGTDTFLDVITWNIKFFNQRDPERVKTITSIMSELNADMFVLQEIEFGSLDPVAESLTRSGAGLYKAVYGTTGGDQRVAFLYDMEWVRASQDVEELFSDDSPTIGSKAVFPRLPLHAKFVARHDEEPFDFHMVGVHLKSQRGGGGDQRSEAAKHLASWLIRGTTDEDAIIAGDWNAPSDRPEWEPIRELEEANLVRFAAWNPNREASHLAKSGRGTRLDFIVTTAAAAGAVKVEGTEVIEFNQLLDERRADILPTLIDKISDHLPVVSRFFFRDEDQRA